MSSLRLDSELLWPEQDHIQNIHQGKGGKAIAKGGDGKPNDGRPDYEEKKKAYVPRGLCETFSPQDDPYESSFFGKEGEVHLDSYNGQGAWRPWSFSLTEDDDEDLLTDEDAMSQDEEEVLSSSWSGSSEGGEFPLIARDKENGISSGKAVTVRERQVVRSRKHRKQQ